MLVVAAVIERDGLLLVGQRPAHKHHGGLWEFPGGKVEPGETPAEALARELHEELGLTDVQVGPELHRHDDPTRPLTLLFLRVGSSWRCSSGPTWTSVRPSSSCSSRARASAGVS
ncbi:MAG: (deoxy)nucleoside triphosphate pyrophosphohydrolase, partial [Myxococcales bacterium]